MGRRTLKNRLRDPSEIHALEFNGEFWQSAICSVSAAIGIDWPSRLRLEK